MLREAFPEKSKKIQMHLLDILRNFSEMLRHVLLRLLENLSNSIKNLRMSEKTLKHNEISQTFQEYSLKANKFLEEVFGTFTKAFPEPNMCFRI